MRAVASLPSGRRAGPAALAGVLLVGSVLAVLNAGCGRNTPPAPVRLRYDRHHATKTYGDCSGGTDRCTRITLRWPMVVAAPTPAARESIGAFIRTTLFRAYDGDALLPGEDSVMAGFIAAYRAFAGGSWRTPSAPWWFERRIEVLGDTLGVTSLAVTERSFTGGAHSNSTTLFVSFDVATGRRLGRADLLLESAEARLDSLGERAFRRVRRLGPDVDLAAAGFWFEGGRFRLNDNLAVTSTGMLFFFNDYEIGPHALGVTQISLPWTEVMACARPDGPLGRHHRPHR